MSATEDAVAPFAIGPVGSADDWEALLARVQTFHGVSWQRRKDINDDDCERTWRRVHGCSAARAARVQHGCQLSGTSS